MNSVAAYYLGKNSLSFDGHWGRAQEIAPEWTSFRFEIRRHSKADATQCFLLFKKTEKKRELDWIDLLNGLLNEGGQDAGLQYPFNIRVHALLGVHFKGHTFFISYGAGHTIARRLRIATRFGRVVAGNSKDAKATRRLKTFVHQFGGRETEVTIAQGDETSAFRTGEEMQTLRSVATSNSFKKPIVGTGGSGYTFWSPEDSADLHRTLDKLIEWWNKGVHKDDVLAQLERFTEVDDDEELSLCRDRFCAAIMSDDHSDFAAVMPGEYWSAIGFQYYPNHEKKKKKKDFLDIVPYNPLTVSNALKKWMTEGNEPETLDIFVHVAEGTHVELCPAANFLSWSFTAEDGKKTYIWDEGSWFSMDADWAADTLREATALFEAESKVRVSFGLPPWDSGTRKISGKELQGEDLFVEDCASSGANPRGVSLHRHLPPKPTTQVELCDVFWKGGHLLFCKHGSSFSPVHEVCGQAVHSIKAIMYDKGFHQWAQEKLKSAGHDLDLRKQAADLRVGIVLAVNSPDRPLKNWSVRSLNCLINTVREIGTSNYQVELHLVSYEAKTPTSYDGPKGKKKLKRKKFWGKPKLRKKD